MQAHLWATSNWHINFGFPIRHLALAAVPQTAKQRRATRKNNAIDNATSVRPKRKNRTLSIISATRSNERRVCWTLRYDASKSVRSRISSDSSSNNCSSITNNNNSSSNSSSNSRTRKVLPQPRRILNNNNSCSNNSSNNSSNKSSNNNSNNNNSCNNSSISSSNSHSVNSCSCNKALPHSQTPVLAEFRHRTRPSCKRLRIDRCHLHFGVAQLSGKFFTNANASPCRNPPNSRRL